MRFSKLALLSIIASMACAGNAQANISYASNKDLAQAARCSVLKFILDAKDMKYHLASAEGTMTFKRVIQQGSKIEAGTTLPFSVIELSPALSRSNARVVTTTEEVDLSVPVTADEYPKGCQDLRIKTLDRRGKPADTQSPLLFTADKLLKSFSARNGLLSTVTIGQTLTTSTTVSGGLKLNIFGLLKIGYDKTMLDASQESGYSVTFKFRNGATNAAGVPHVDKK